MERGHQEIVKGRNNKGFVNEYADAATRDDDDEAEIDGDDYDDDDDDDGSEIDYPSYDECEVNLNSEIAQSSLSKKQGALLFVIFVSYLLIGGGVFMVLESQHEKQQRRNVLKIMKNVEDNLFQADRHNFTRKNLKAIINELAHARDVGLIDENGNQTHNKWDYANSVFFAVTVVTTIGYGNLYPATPFGRTFCVLYGMVGIPLTGILLAGIGDHFSIQLMKALNKAKRTYTSKLAIGVNTLSVFIPWLLVFVFLPAGLFMMLERWSYDEALYYSFVTLATIGFGDFVAASKSVDYIWLYKTMLVAWIIFGLGYLSTILNFISKAMQSKKLKNVEDRISQKFNRFKIVIGDHARRRRSLANRSIRSVQSNGIGKPHRRKMAQRRSQSLDFDVGENDLDNSVTTSFQGRLNIEDAWAVSSRRGSPVTNLSQDVVAVATSNDFDETVKRTNVRYENNNNKNSSAGKDGARSEDDGGGENCDRSPSSHQDVVITLEPSKKSVEKFLKTFDDTKTTEL